MYYDPYEEDNDTTDSESEGEDREAADSVSEENEDVEIEEEAVTMSDEQMPPSGFNCEDDDDDEARIEAIEKLRKKPKIYQQIKRVI